MINSIVGVNVLTVLISKADEINKLKAFFCPYSRNMTQKYLGQVTAIYPGYDAEETPQFIVRPQREYRNINYSFREASNIAETISFWIQDQYFNQEPVKTYYCINCQNPQLYFTDNKAVYYKNKAELKSGDNYICDNCKESLTFMGIVAIRDVNNI